MEMLAPLLISLGRREAALEGAGGSCRPAYPEGNGEGQGQGVQDYVEALEANGEQMRRARPARLPACVPVS